MSRTIKALGGAGTLLAVAGFATGVTNACHSRPADGIYPVTSAVAAVMGEEVARKCRCAVEAYAESGSCYVGEVDMVGEWECDDPMIVGEDGHLRTPETIAEEVAAGISNLQISTEGCALLALACVLAARGTKKKGNKPSDS